MSRIITTSTPGKERDQLSKAIVITVREFMRQQEPDDNSLDMIAFIILALQTINSGIDQTVTAWEKRDFWFKADKFRLEWQWTGEFANRLAFALAEKNWGEIAQILMEIMGKFSNIKVSDRHRMGKPWVGAFRKYINMGK